MRGKGGVTKSSYTQIFFFLCVCVCYLLYFLISFVSVLALFSLKIERISKGIYQLNVNEGLSTFRETFLATAQPTARELPSKNELLENSIDNASTANKSGHTPSVDNQTRAHQKPMTIIIGSLPQSFRLI